MCRRMIHALERPATTASATKSCALTASVSPRTCRAKRGHSSSAITSTTLRKLGSDTATMTTAMRMVGSDRPMSVSRMSSASTSPPRYPEIRPSSVPSVPATPMATSETSSEMRLPQMTRLSTSRPKRSVPSRWSAFPPSIQIGGIDFLTMSPAVGLCGARYGANTAVTTRAARIAPANHGYCRLRAAMTDPRIEIAVQQIHAQVAGEVERAQHQHAGLHDRVVAGCDRFKDQPPEARPREHRLGHDGAAQKLHEQQDRKGDHGQQRVAQAVLPQHERLRQPLQPGELDVVRAEHLQHGRAGEAQDGRGGEVAQRDAGRIRCRRPPRPPAGSTPSTTPKKRMSMSPSQKVGIDCPRTANTRAARSSSLPRYTAEYTPSGTPMRTLRSIATTPSSIVAGSRSRMCSVTGRRVRIELPKSPSATFRT